MAYESAEIGDDDLGNVVSDGTWVYGWQGGPTMVNYNNAIALT